MTVKIYKNSERDNTSQDLGCFDEKVFAGLVSKLPIYSELEESVGLCRSQEDYLDVSKQSHSTYLLYSEKLFPGQPWWRQLISSHVISKEITGIDAVKQAAKDYVNETRATFEAKYT